MPSSASRENSMRGTGGGGVSLLASDVELLLSKQKTILIGKNSDFNFFKEIKFREMPTACI